MSRIVIKRVTPIQNPNSKTIAYASVALETDLGVIEISDIAVINGSKGLFMRLPQRRYELNGETKYANYVFLSTELYDQVSELILQEADPHAGQERFEATDDDIPF